MIKLVVLPVCLCRSKSFHAIVLKLLRFFIVKLKSLHGMYFVSHSVVYMCSLCSHIERHNRLNPELPEQPSWTHLVPFQKCFSLLTDQFSHASWCFHCLPFSGQLEATSFCCKRISLLTNFPPGSVVCVDLCRWFVTQAWPVTGILVLKWLVWAYQYFPWNIALETPLFSRKYWYSGAKGLRTRNKNTK